MYGIHHQHQHLFTKHHKIDDHLHLPPREGIPFPHLTWHTTMATLSGKDKTSASSSCGRLNCRLFPEECLAPTLGTVSPSLLLLLLLLKVQHILETFPARPPSTGWIEPSRLVEGSCGGGGGGYMSTAINQHHIPRCHCQHIPGGSCLWPKWSPPPPPPPTSICHRVCTEDDDGRPHLDIEPFAGCVYYGDGTAGGREGGTPSSGDN